ncbi:MAG TPA: hypothetical protein VFA32_13180 [Dehalococcoidia bacterium]|jgi:hypothetical protein|nr:hypothetical protein [Dehalococcoidia bacterium]
MVSAPAKARKRLTQAEALEQARERIRAEKEAPKQSTDKDGSGSGGRERWLLLPKHLSMYAGEQGVVDQGRIWSHRADRRAARTDANGVKHTPVRLINLGPVDALDPNYKRENNGPGQPTAKGAKTPSFVLGSKASGSSDHLLETEGVLSPPGGRPRKDGQDDLIAQWAGEGLGAKAISRLLRRDGADLSPRTVSRRLEKLRE